MSTANYQLGFSTLDREVQLNQLPLKGELPQWVTGTLIRTGPAQFEVGKQSYRHWFDGLAMLHAFSFSGGQVSYTNKFLESQAYTKAKENGKISRSEFATDPCRSIFGRVLSFFQSKPIDNANVNISKLADRYVALTETPLPIVFDPETLNTLGRFDYKNQLEGQMTTAHSHFDFNRKVLYSYQTYLSRKSYYNLYQMEADGERQQLVVSIPIEEPAYMHSFGMSQNYLILVEFPFVVNPLKLAIRALTNTPLIENFRWKPEKGTRFYIINKDNKNVVHTGISEPIFAFHHVNAFEQNNQLVVDMAVYADASIIEAFYLDRLRNQELGNVECEFRRYYLPLDGSEVKYEVLYPGMVEFPRINYQRCGGKNYRYVWGGGNSVPNNFIDQLVKIDIEQRTARIWQEDNCYPGEPVFVAAPNADQEDEGIILSVVLNAERSNSFLLVLEAQSFVEIARAEVPHHIPFGLHGQYFANISTNC